MPVTFGEFVLDRGTRQLLRGGEPRALGPKAFDLLDLLLNLRPDVVPKERIRDRLWPSTFVSESTLATVVQEIRSALGDDAKYVRGGPADLETNAPLRRGSVPRRAGEPAFPRLHGRRTDTDGRRLSGGLTSFRKAT